MHFERVLAVVVVLLIMPLGIGTAQSKKTDAKKSEVKDKDSLLHFVSDDVSQVSVIRPAKLMNSRDFKNLQTFAGDDLEKITKRFLNRYFDYALTRPEEIEGLLTADWMHRHDNNSQTYHQIVVLKTTKDSSDRFDMATHAVKSEQDFEGKKIFHMKSPLDATFAFACIYDKQTIIWGRDGFSIEQAIRYAKAGPKNKKWYQHWQSFDDDHIRLLMTLDESRRFSAPPLIRKAKGLQYLVGSLKLGKTSMLKVKGNCENASQAANIVELANDTLESTREQLSQRLTNSAPNQEFVKLQLDAANAIKVDHQSTQVFAQGKLRVDFKSLLAPMKQMYEAQQRTAAANNMRQNALAVHNFESAFQHLPTSVFTHESGKKYSWRIAILPFIGRQDIYDQYDFTQEWDSPHNLEVTSKMPDFFRSDLDDRDSTNTSFFMLTGEGGMFGADKPLQFRDIKDGTSNTILLIQAQREIHWAKPEDIEIDPEKPLPDFGGFHQGGYNVAMADGSVRFMSEKVVEDHLRAMLTRDGGEVIERETPLTDDE